MGILKFYSVTAPKLSSAYPIAISFIHSFIHSFIRFNSGSKAHKQQTEAMI